MANENYAYILTVNEKYWSRLSQLNKETLGTHVFTCKSQVAPKHVQRLVTRKSQILGAADFVERLTGNYQELWRQFGGESCFESFDEYNDFVDGRGRVTFIRFSNSKRSLNMCLRRNCPKSLVPSAGLGLEGTLSGKLLCSWCKELNL